MSADFREPQASEEDWELALKVEQATVALNLALAEARDRGLTTTLTAVGPPEEAKALVAVRRVYNIPLVP